MENKKLYCDLHTHSTKSDGELSREEIIELAIENDIGALAITDHNVPFRDIEKLQAKYPDIKLINGAEISTCYDVPETGEKKEIHVIALDFENTEHFTAVLRHNRIKCENKDYVNRIIQKLSEAGLEVNFTYDDLRTEMDQEFIGIMAAARKLVNLGLVSDIQEAFDEYIGEFGRRKAYVKPDVSKYMPMNVAIIEIRNADGIPVLCHPYSYGLSEEQVVRLIQDFKKYGGFAIETLYPQYTSEQTEQLIEYSVEYDLLNSAGSDLHDNSWNSHFPIAIYNGLAKLKASMVEKIIAEKEAAKEEAKKQEIKDEEEKRKRMIEEEEELRKNLADFWKNYVSEDLSRCFRSGEPPFDELDAHALFSYIRANGKYPDDETEFRISRISQRTKTENIIFYIKRVHTIISEQKGYWKICSRSVRSSTLLYIRILNESLTDNEIDFIYDVFGLTKEPVSINEAAEKHDISNERFKEISLLLFEVSRRTAGLWRRSPLSEID